MPRERGAELQLPQYKRVSMMASKPKGYFQLFYNHLYPQSLIIKKLKDTDSTAVYLLNNKSLFSSLY